jgi:hypothetical protein
VNYEKKWGTKRGINGHVITIASLVIIFVYIAVSFALPEVTKLLGKESLPKELNFAIIFSVCFCTMLIVSPWIATNNINRDRDEQTKKLKEIADMLNDSSHHIKEHISTSIIKEVKLIKNKNDFFRELNNERDNIKKDVDIRLMNFANTIREQEDDERSARKYYDNEIEFYYNRSNDNVKLFKIVSIHTKEKFIECWNLAKKAENRELENFNLAYICINKFEEKIMPEITGVQIIGDVVILMDPNVARIDAANHKYSMYIRSKIIAEKYSSYHEY